MTSPREHREHHRADADAFVEQAASRLRSQGGRMTRERLRMLEVLARHSEHLSADAVAAQLDAEGIHRATVFRSLEAFAAAGIVTHRQDPGGATAYHLATPSHLHAHCSSCGEVVALPTDLFDEPAQRVMRLTGFRLDADRSAIGGLCAQCAAREDGPVGETIRPE